MVNEISIQAAFSKDIPTIIHLAHEIWNQHYVGIVSQEQVDYMLALLYSEQKIQQQLNDGHHFYLMIVDHQPVGYFCYFKQPDGSYLLQKLYFKADQQRKGLGKKALQYILDQIPKDSIYV